MGDFDPEFIQTLKTQSWSLYSVGMLFILMRLYVLSPKLAESSTNQQCPHRYARAKRLGGVRNYEVDDYLQLLVAVGSLRSLILAAWRLTRRRVSTRR
jgi:hypothetical protein